MFIQKLLSIFLATHSTHSEYCHTTFSLKIVFSQNTIHPPTPEPVHSIFDLPYQMQQRYTELTFFIKHIPSILSSFGEAGHMGLNCLAHALHISVGACVIGLYVTVVIGGIALVLLLDHIYLDNGIYNMISGALYNAMHNLVNNMSNMSDMDEPDGQNPQTFTGH